MGAGVRLGVGMGVCFGSAVSFGVGAGVNLGAAGAGL